MCELHTIKTLDYVKHDKEKKKVICMQHDEWTYFVGHHIPLTLASLLSPASFTAALSARQGKRKSVIGGRKIPPPRYFFPWHEAEFFLKLVWISKAEGRYQ